MLLTGLVLLSVALRLVGAVLALRLIRLTRWRGPWLALAVALAMMSAREVLSLAHLGLGDAAVDPWAEALALAISIAILVGILRLRPAFDALQGTQEDLRRTGQTLRAVIDASPVAIVALDDADKVTMWSGAAERIFGWKAEEVLGGPNPFIRGEAVEEAAALAARTRSGESLTDREIVRSRRDGSLIPLSLSTAPLRDAAGNVCGRVGLVADIRERKRAEAARELFERAVAQSSDGIGISGADHKVQYVNPALVRLLGHPAEEMLGQSWHDLARRALGRAEAEQLLRTGRFAGSAVRRDGARLALDVALSRLHGPDGTVTHEICALRDVSREREIEEQLQRAQKMEVVGRLAGGMAHDFNNLLTAISGYAAIALGRLRRDDPACGDVQEVLAAAERAAALTRQLLAFSRKEPIRARPLDVDRLVANLDRMLRRLIGEDLVLTVSPAGGGWVKADPGHLEQVIVNLALNARDAMPRGGRLTIATSCEQLDAPRTRRHAVLAPGRYVKLSVADNGHGMDEAVLGHLFEPFFTTKGPGKGTGLGLATAYGIVQRSGGAIAVESAPSQGSTFEVWLPRVEAEQPTEVSFPTASLAHGSETVLVVEDEVGVREFACRLLTAAGYRVLSAANGAEAIRLSSRHAGEIDLVLTDVVMPGINGPELADRLRSEDPELKVLFMSGYTDDTLGEHPGLRLMAKPFSGPALTRAVRAALDDASEGGLDA